MKLVGIILIALGIIALVYQGFNYTKQEDVAKLGSLEMTVKENKTVSIHPIFGVIAIVAGCVLVIKPKFLFKS